MWTDAYTLYLAAAVLQFPDNPLHAPSTSTILPSRSKRHSSPRDEDADDEDGSSPFLMGAPAAFTIQIPTGGPGSMARSSRGGGSAGVISPMSRGALMPTQRVKAFFDELLNLTNPSPSSSSSSSSSSEKDVDALRRPRIVYVRNYPHIADHVPTWFPGLQAAVRARRQGPMARPTSPVAGPTVIILGSSPPILGDSASSSSSSSSRSRSSSATSSIISLLQAAGRLPSSPKSSSSSPIVESSWNENDRKSRERRLKERLRKWMKGRGQDGLVDDIPPFTPSSSSASTSMGGRRMGMGMMPELSLGSNVIAIPFGQSSSSSSDDPSSSAAGGGNGYFRVVGLVPRTRDEGLERTSRMRYRLQANALALKLAVAEAGGVLAGVPDVSMDAVIKSLETPSPSSPLASSSLTVEGESSTADVVESAMVASAIEHQHQANQSLPQPPSQPLSFLESCLITIKPWRDLKVIADAVVGAALSNSASERGLLALDSSIEPTTVTWDQVSRSVESNAESTSLRNAWIEGIHVSAAAKEAEEAVSGGTGKGVGADGDGVPVLEVDEVLEAVKNDPDLDQHEQRLLGCIVDPGELQTSFLHVHYE